MVYIYILTSAHVDEGTLNISAHTHAIQTLIAQLEEG